MSENSRKWFWRALVVLVAVFALAMAVLYKDQLYALTTQAEARAQLIAWVQSKGAYGVLFFLFLIVVQVLVSFIPGEPFEIAAGILYGAVGGLLISLIGVAIAMCIIFGLAKLARVSPVSPEKLHRYRFLKNDKRIRVVLFLIFFIPGIPKDLLLYFAPLLPLPPLHFFAIALVARIPSILTSTIAGQFIAQGNWVVTAAVFAVTGIVSLGCIVFNTQLEGLLHRLSQHKDKPSL